MKQISPYLVIPTLMLSAIPFVQVNAAFSQSAPDSSNQKNAAAAETIRAPKNEAPVSTVAPLINSPEGKVPTPSSEFLKAPKSSGITPTASELLSSPKGTIQATTEMISAPKGDVPPAAEVLSAPKGSTAPLENAVREPSQIAPTPKSSEILKSPAGSVLEPSKSEFVSAASAAAPEEAITGPGQLASDPSESTPKAKILKSPGEAGETPKPQSEFITGTKAETTAN
jgi:hypothetical protein